MRSMLLLLQTALADCTSGDLSVMPPIGSTLPSRPELVVHAYGTERSTLSALGPDDLKLRTSTGREVGVEVVAHHHGSFTDDQLVVRPTEVLPSGTVTLVLRGKTPTQWVDGKHAPMAWTVGEPGRTIPTWTQAPELAGTQMLPMGCGPSTHATVTTPVSAPWIEVELTSAKGVAVTGRLAVRDGSIAIGHGMCSGLFELETGTSYTARLTAVGLDGSRIAAPTPVQFVAP